MLEKNSSITAKVKEYKTSKTQQIDTLKKIWYGLCFLSLQKLVNFN